MRTGIAVLTGLCAASCAGSSATAPADSPGVTTAASIGIHSITSADLRGHVELLASDAYEGRETLEPGYELAAKHLSGQFEAYGLSPLPGRDSFVVDYPLYRLGFDADHTKVAVTVNGQTRTLAAGTDFSPFSFSEQGAADVDVVFAGYGITAPDLNYDDYADLDVTGKVVLVLRHAPNEKDEGSPFKGGAHQAFVTKAANAQEHGAVGMLLVTDPRHHAKDADDMRMTGFLAVEPPSPRGERPDSPEAGDETDAKPPFLAVHVTQDATAAMVAGTGKSLEDIQVALDGGAPAKSFDLGAVRASLAVKALDAPEKVSAKNVAGFLEGSDPTLKSEWVVIGAHYDHLGAYHGGGDTVYNGADDNASGTAGMLELAQAFASLPTPPKRSIAFIGFSGEEKGLLGSRAMVAADQLPMDRVVFMLNLDMIGRNPKAPVAVVGDGYSVGIRPAVEAANAGVELPIEFGGDDYAGNSDHHPFYASDVPFLFFFTGLHDDYHQLSDHANLIEYDRMADITRLAYGTVERVASGEVTPSFVHHVTWLGLQVQVVDGAATITAVEDGSRGATAGLKVGDIVTGFSEASFAAADVGKEFRNIEPGAETTLHLRRGDADVSVPVTRAKRGYLGVAPGQLSDEDRQKHGLPEDEGVLIRGASPDGPAANAGMQEGDILIRIAGLPVGTRTLGKHLARIGAGETVKIVVIRAGERVTLELTLGERPERRRRRP